LGWGLATCGAVLLIGLPALMLWDWIKDRKEKG